MAVRSFEFSISMSGFCDLANVTERVAGFVAESGLANGIACVAVVGSTGV